MDVTQSLKDAENSLRDFIAAFFNKKYGDKWVEHLGVPPERIQKWIERKEVEGKRQESGVVEERLLYYADFYDLKTILKKSWSDFAEALGEWKTMEVWLTELERLRDPDAHRRELLPHQKHLILGISGEIRTRIVRYRSKQEAVEDYFPRIESVRDSLGNIRVPGQHVRKVDATVLRPGDVIDFVVTATDPLGERLSYCIYPDSRDLKLSWQDNAEFSFRIEEQDIRARLGVVLFIKSNRDYHAHGFYDDSQKFVYTVLPAKKEQ